MCGHGNRDHACEQGMVRFPRFNTDCVKKTSCCDLDGASIAPFFRESSKCSMDLLQSELRLVAFLVRERFGSCNSMM